MQTYDIGNDENICCMHHQVSIYISAPVIRPYGRDAKYSGYRTIDDDEPPLPLPSESIPTSKTTPNREKVAVDNHTYSTPTDNITPTATDTTRTNHGYGNPMFGRVPPNGSTNMVVSTQQTYSTDRHGGRHDSDHDDRNVRHDVMVAQRSDAERSGDTGIDTTHRFGDNHFTNSRASALRGDPDNRSSSKSGSVITVREGPTFRNLPPGFTRETFSEKFEENYKIEGPTIGRNHFESRELL
ncbi:hypothetical protein AB6A40_010123 [Gnathostoma spinigerum]|uniref:Uncharacterized protein n=1 Tax=Gnathostoma spinigerum TaxID=75299 RepID=A0ABD6ETW4_9BILA